MPVFETENTSCRKKHLKHEIRNDNGRRYIYNRRLEIIVADITSVTRYGG
jgi:hypothetical protein